MVVTQRGKYQFMSELEICEWAKDKYSISTDKEKLNIQEIHRYLIRSTWAEGISIKTVADSIQNSLSFGVYNDNRQVGFARLITDYSTFAYLCDVYILEEYQGKGLGGWLMQCIHSHPVYEKLRRIVLFTSTAPWLYEKYGYEPVNRPNFAWSITRSDIYSQSQS
jgi:GNAT superfamily N-acetyltransferase